MPDISLVNSANKEVEYSNVDTVVLNTTDGGTATYVSEHLIQNQVQADWNQTDDTQPDYIKNKPETFESEPELPEVTTDDNGKVFLGVVDGAWGAVPALFGTIDRQVNVEWDTSVTPTVTFDATEFGMTLHKIADVTPTKEQILSAAWRASSSDGSSMYDFTVSESEIAIETDKSMMFQLSATPRYAYIIVYSAGEITFNYSGVDVTLTAPETGLYQAWDLSVALPTTLTGSISYTVTEEVNFVQADWNQNDSTEPAFIKNRPFYEDLSVIFEGEFVDVYDETSSSWSGETLVEDSSSANLVVGETYTYVWDGQEYTSVCVNTNGLLMIGNTDALSGGDNGQPVVIARDCNGGMIVDSPSWAAIFLTPPTDPDISGVYPCTIIGSAIKTIDPKYISDVPWNKISDKPFGDIAAGTVICEESIVTGSYDSSDTTYGANLLTTLNPSAIVVDAGYTVYIDDMELSGTGTQLNDVATIVPLVDSNSIQVAVIMSDGEMVGIQTLISTFPNGTTYNVKVVADTVIAVKINSKYLPDIGSGLPESTSADSGKVLTVDGTGVASWFVPTTELPSVTTADVGKFLRVSDDGSWVAESISTWLGGSY